MLILEERTFSLKNSQLMFISMTEYNSELNVILFHMFYKNWDAVHLSHQIAFYGVMEVLFRQCL